MAFEISCPTCTSLGTERTIAGAMKLALAHAPQHSPVYIAGDGARFTIRHDGKPAIEVRFDDALPDRHHLARRWDEPVPPPPMPARAKDMVLERRVSATPSKFCGRRRAAGDHGTRR
jgi:hypothetical protein